MFTLTYHNLHRYSSYPTIKIEVYKTSTQRICRFILASSVNIVHKLPASQTAYNQSF